MELKFEGSLCFSGDDTDCLFYSMKWKQGIVTIWITCPRVSSVFSILKWPGWAVAISFLSFSFAWAICGRKVRTWSSTEERKYHLPIFMSVFGQTFKVQNFYKSTSQFDRNTNNTIKKHSKSFYFKTFHSLWPPLYSSSYWF